MWHLVFNFFSEIVHIKKNLALRGNAAGEMEDMLSKFMKIWPLNHAEIHLNAIKMASINSSYYDVNENKPLAKIKSTCVFDNVVYSFQKRLSC